MYLRLRLIVSSYYAKISIIKLRLIDTKAKGRVNGKSKAEKPKQKTKCEQNGEQSNEHK